MFRIPRWANAPNRTVARRRALRSPIIAGICGLALLVLPAQGQWATIDEESQPPTMLRFELRHYEFRGDVNELGPTVDAVRLAEMVDNGTEWRLIRRFQIATLSDQKARVQIGGNVSVVAGETTNASRNNVRNYMNHQVGAMAQFIGRATPQGVVVDLSYECSKVGDRSSTDDESAIGPAPIETLTVETTVLVPSGSPVAMELSGDAASQRAVIVLAVRRDEPQAAEMAPVRELRGRIEIHVPPTDSGGPSDSAGEARPAPGDRSEREPNVDSPSIAPGADERYANYSRAVIGKYDTNQDGLLEPSEMERSALLDSLRKTFRELDANDDGKVSPEELTGALRPRGSSRPE